MKRLRRGEHKCPKMLMPFTPKGKMDKKVSAQHFLEPLEEEAGLVHGQAERRQEADDVGAAHARKDVLLLEQAQAQVFDGFVELEADHQAAAAYVLDLGQFLQLVQQVGTYTGGILDQVFLLHDVEHGQGGRAGQVVTSEGGAQLAVDGCEHGADEHAGHGEAVADALGHGDDVGTDALVLVGEELAATSVAALYLVEDEHRARLRAGLTEGVHEFVGGQLDAAYTLDAFDDDGADITLGQFGLHGGRVVEWQVDDVAAIVDGGDDFGVVGHLDGQRRTAVEGFGKRHHPCASVVEGGQLEGVLVGFGTAVDEEERVVFVAAGLAQSFGHLLLELVDDGVGVEAQGGYLVADHLHVVRMGVADGDDGMAAVEVEVLRTVLVPHVAAFPFDDVDVEQRIYIE